MSPGEQYRIDCEYLVYFRPKRIKEFKKKKIYKRDIMQLFSADATIFFEKLNNLFFSIASTGPAQISYSVP